MSYLPMLIKGKPLSILLKIIGWLLMAFATVCLVITLTHSWDIVLQHWPNLAPHRKMKQIGKQIGKFAEFAVFGTAGFWVMKQLFIESKKRNLPFASLLQRLMLFLKRNHTFLGWVAFIVALSHGSYFLLYREDKVKYIYTGLGAFAGLVAVMLAGVYFSNKQKGKESTVSNRKWHFITALGFIVVFMIHLYY